VSSCLTAHHHNTQEAQLMLANPCNAFKSQSWFPISVV